MIPSDKIARTCGDGMENSVTNLTPNNESKPQHSAISNADIGKIAPTRSASSADGSYSLNGKVPGQELIYKQNYATPSPPAVLPKGKIFNMIPRLMVSTRKTSSFSVQHRNKAPRFVPFEPYKAAINPIIPLQPKTVQKNRKNNLDLNTLVSHMSSMKMTSLKPTEASADENKLSEIEKQRRHFERQLDDLRKDRDCVSAQLKSQVQVNTELKNLLVAAVGEDLQTRVNVLTEDKLELARALLSSADDLSSHTEQIEFLAGQSEVWRSKFLASSLMVEELARWKASLTAKNLRLIEANKQMLQTLSTVRDFQIETWTNLKFLCGQRDANLRSSNVLDLTAECGNISQQLVLHSGIGMPAPINLVGLDKSTDAEKLAVLALENSNEPLMSTDEAFIAIVGQAFPVASKRYPSIPVETDTGTQ